MSKRIVEVNGFAIREIRIRSGLEIDRCAKEAGISRSYLCRIELGGRIRVTVPVFTALLNVLQIDDHRALLSNPHGTEVQDERAPVHDGPARRQLNAFSPHC